MPELLQTYVLHNNNNIKYDCNHCAMCLEIEYNITMTMVIYYHHVNDYDYNYNKNYDIIRFTHKQENDSCWYQYTLTYFMQMSCVHYKTNSISKETMQLQA